MWIDTSEGRAYLTHVCRGVVTQAAPEELDIFDELMAEYYADPTPPKLQGGQDEALGLGLEATLVAITPAAAAMASGVLAYVSAEVLKTFQEESAAALSERVRGLFAKEDRQQAEKPAVPPLTPEQLKEVRRVARRQARAFGVEDEVAKRLADALIGNLAIS